ncbi:MAG: hypothetical protein GTO55_02895 [Armatimonadetes bacterium]|nr:hypothetical protein [Armatimonadota bacterium]NIM23223.1 hypothetical protein [Armatimonadota bacterium]NIM67091.1 hypothetical protein [Armatimonadota bacterium]NIN05280.1 hypothetical protein [Armatimonadota bacterium]NIO96359.1 hypothetical protein [Armatimonadota bacterium]
MKPKHGDAGNKDEGVNTVLLPRKYCSADQTILDLLASQGAADADEASLVIQGVAPQDHISCADFYPHRLF